MQIQQKLTHPERPTFNPELLLDLVEECIFDYMTSHIECKFNKNSLQSDLPSILSFFWSMMVLCFFLLSISTCWSFTSLLIFTKSPCCRSQYCCNSRHSPLVDSIWRCSVFTCSSSGPTYASSCMEKRIKTITLASKNTKKVVWSSLLYYSIAYCMPIQQKLVFRAKNRLALEIINTEISNGNYRKYLKSKNKK